MTALPSGLALSLRTQHRARLRCLGPKPPVLTEFQARRTAELWLTADYRSPRIPGDWVCSTDDLPDWLKRGRGESLADWRDRLWLQFRTPRVTAALDDIKLAYAEVANPLLSRNVVKAILDLPPELRAGKTLFREIVREMFPSVPFAGRVAIQHSRDVVLQPGFDLLFHDELDRCDATTALSAALLRLLGESVAGRTAGQSMRWRARKTLKRWLPPAAAVWRYRLMTHDTLDPRQIAVRALLALRTTRLFEEDAALGHAAAIRSPREPPRESGTPARLGDDEATPGHDARETCYRMKLLLIGPASRGIAGGIRCPSIICTIRSCKGVPR